MTSDKNIRLIEKILSNTASNAEIETFNAWLEESGENQKFFQQVRAIWERLDRTKDHIEFDTAVAQKRMVSIIDHRRTKTRLLKVRFRIAVAASILLLIGLSYLVYNSVNPASNTTQYSSLENEIKEVVLSDGSHVWLNENSNLQVTKAFNKRQRKVILQGEAYFEVALNKNKAFKVITSKTTTIVLGTSFNLKADERDNVQLIVKTGRVEFYNRFSFKKRNVFSAGAKGEYLSASGQILKLTNKNMNYLSWKTGILTFSNTPLDEVCKALKTHYKINIKSTVDNPRFSLTGTFQNENLEDILSTIAITLDIKVTRSKSGVIISRYNNN